jgi:hypothetical protein
VDITLSLAFLEEHQLLPPRAGPDDDRLLAQHASVTAAFSESHGSKSLGHQAQSSEVAAIFNHIAPEIFDGAIATGATETQAESSNGASAEKVSREATAGNPKTSLAGRDAWTLDKALKLREELQHQLRNPDPEMNRRLNEVADKYAEAFGTDISRPCRLKKFSVKMKDGAQFVAMVPRRFRTGATRN